VRPRLAGLGVFNWGWS